MHGEKGAPTISATQSTFVLGRNAHAAQAHQNEGYPSVQVAAQAGETLSREDWQAGHHAAGHAGKATVGKMFQPAAATPGKAELTGSSSAIKIAAATAVASQKLLQASDDGRVPTLPAVTSENAMGIVQEGPWALSSPKPLEEVVEEHTSHSSEQLAQPLSRPVSKVQDPLGRRDELAKLHEAFGLIDLDGNGYLTRGEIIRGCREKEPVRLLMGLPRNLRGDAEATVHFDQLFAHLDPDDSGKVDLDEFCTFFMSDEGLTAVAALSTPPSWHAVAKNLSLDPSVPPAERAKNGFALWASEARFVHKVRN